MKIIPIAAKWSEMSPTAQNLATDPLCFTLPKQAETTRMFIAAIKGIVGWKLQRPAKPPITTQHGGSVARAQAHSAGPSLQRKPTM